MVSATDIATGKVVNTVYKNQLAEMFIPGNGHSIEMVDYRNAWTAYEMKPSFDNSIAQNDG